MSGQPRPPIVVISNAGADVDVFPSVEATLSYVEVYEVRDGEYEFFDVTGHPLQALTHNWAVTALDRTPGVHSYRGELTERVRQKVHRIGVDRVELPSVDSAELEELVHALLRYEERFQAEHSLTPRAVLRRLRRKKSSGTT